MQFNLRGVNMTNFNLVVIEGRLTKDAELKQTTRGTAMLKFSLANNYYKKENGEKKQSVMFFNVVAWEKLAEIMGKYLKKGMPVIVSGRLVVDKYTAKTGQEKTSIQIIANNIDFISYGNGKKNFKTADEKIPY